MLLVTLTSAALLAVAPIVPVVATTTAPISIEASVPDAANPHLQNARAALEQGNVALARREYQFAQVVDRDAGVIPVEASNGLAGLLYAHAQPREAAEVLQQLANEAARAGKIDVEASALVHATWLRIECGDRIAAKEGVRRLHEIARDNSISSETRALLKRSLK